MSATVPFRPDALSGVIFDLDGTLIDSYAAIAGSVNAARARFALPPLSEADVRAEVGHGLEPLIARLVGPDRVAHGVETFREHYDAICVEQTRVLPGVPIGLGRLVDLGFRLAVASNKPARFGRRLLEGLRLSDRFCAVLGPDSVGSAKPDPAMLRTCLEAMRLARDQVVYVGDMLLDIETARRAGVPVVLLSWGSQGADELRQSGERVFDSLDPLVDLLQEARGNFS